jgi:hypothetical protein
MIGYDPDMDYLLDPQQQRPFCMCSSCGREIYRPFQQTCDICLMDIEVEEDEDV